MALFALISSTNPKLAATIRSKVPLRALAKWTGCCGLLVVVLASSGCSSLASFRTRPFNNQQARNWTNGGLEAFRKGRLNLAQSCFAKAMNHNPNDTQIQTYLAETLAEKGDHASAIHQLELAIDRADRPDANAHVRLGQLYLENGQWLPARRQAEIALKVDRHFADAWHLKGKTEYAKGSWGNALADFQRALSYQPKNEDIHLRIAATYRQLNQPMRSLATVEELLSRYSEGDQPEQAVIAKSEALMAMQHNQTAIEVLKVASHRPGASSQVFVRLGKAQLLAGQTSQARMTLNQAMQRFPDEKELDSLVADLQPVRRDVALNDNQ